MSKSTTHQNYAHTWWTPPEWMEWVEETFGCVPFDPCPRDWKPGHPDGLESDWGWCNYCNHPGSRGSTARWWAKFAKEMTYKSGIWCAFNDEQKRHMRPSPYHLDGWLIEPRKRIGFIWGGPDTDRIKHGERGKSPGNWTVFWSSVEPAEPPEECVIVRTGL